MTRFVGPDPGLEQPSSPTGLRDEAAALPPGRRRGLLLASAAAGLGLGFLVGAIVTVAERTVSTATPEVAAAPPHTRPQLRTVSEPSRFWRPAGSIAQRPALRLEPRRYRPALRLAGSN